MAGCRNALNDLFSAMDEVMLADNSFHGDRSNASPGHLRTPSTPKTPSRISNTVVSSHTNKTNERSAFRQCKPKKIQSKLNAPKNNKNNSPKIFKNLVQRPGSSTKMRDNLTVSSSNIQSVSSVHNQCNREIRLQGPPPKLRCVTPSDSLSIHKRNVKTGENRCNKVNDKALPSNKKFGFKKLSEMLNDWDSDKITLYICQNADVFETLAKEKIRHDLLELLLKVVVKMMDTSFKESKIKVYSLLCGKNFVECLTLYITSTIVNVNCSMHKQGMVNFFDNLNLFLQDIINLMPYKAMEALQTLVDVEILFLNQKQCGCFKNTTQVSVKLKGDLELNKERWEKMGNDPKLMKKREFSTPPDDFHSISLYPTPEDFMGRNFLRENIVDGSYDDVYHYLDVQFRLLREDFIVPLRVGIRDYHDSLTSTEKVRKKNFNIKIYNNVKFLNVFLDFRRNSEISYIISLPQSLTKKIKWEYSKRLLFGSLVLFSRDNFETFQLATVSDRDVEMLRQKGIIKVTLVGQNIFGRELFSSDFVMVESSAFFEPIYQVLKTMQELPLVSFPMERYILVHDNSPGLPRYLESKHEIVITSDNGSVFRVNINDDSSWPPCQLLNFNQSQALAFKSVFQSEFSVVQGPPGTGKTYLGLKIVKTILDNFDFDSPILMVCYTNHALDQFLEGMLTFTEEIVRIGGQSKNDALNKFNYSCVWKRHAVRHFGISELKENMSECLSRLSSNHKLLESLSSDSCGIINIFKYKNDKLRRTFENSNDFLNWLLGDTFDYVNYIMQEYSFRSQPLIPVNKPTKPPINAHSNNFGFEDNECDNDEELMDLFAGVEGEIHFSLVLKNLYGLISNMQDFLFKLNNDGGSSDEKQLVINDLNDFQIFINDLIRRLNDVGQKPSMKDKDLFRRNIWDLSDNDRWALYHFWIQQIYDDALEEITKDQNQYNILLKEWKEIKLMEDFDTLVNLKPKILGLTTTGAARHHSLISVLKPRIIIVEEAAEVLEAHIVTALTPSCEHLILIGDHKQLKPNPSTFKLAKDYHLDISLFERMINSGVGCFTLNVQHRMKPNIASLIAPTIYPDLTNHSSVDSYPPVLGVQKNLFFIDHNFPESNDEFMESKKNLHEAEFMIKFCRHLLLQGYSPSDITILTIYSGQQCCLRELKKGYPLLREVKMTVVDNYQGEECKIILLSLVRSNETGKIGFLNIENRVCVALSRAKHGLYIIGNMNLLKSNSDIWQKIDSSLKSQAAIGDRLGLVCQIHSETITEVQCANDFDTMPEGGCSKFCLRLMGCGHTCPSVCHIVDQEHSDIKCLQPCTREICSEPNHACPLRCYETCKPCEVKMNRTLPECKHEVELPCHIDVEVYKCLVTVSNVKPDCGHRLDHLCHQDILNVTCYLICEIRLDCGHSCVKKCHVKDDPDHMNYICNKDCTKKNALCKKNHTCGKRCWEDCGVCTVQVDRKMPCGHFLKIPCFEDPGNVLCPRDCKKTLPCGHKCKKKCHEECGGCKVKVVKDIPECGHKINSRCSDPVKRSMCRKACKNKLSCGHPCKLKCAQDCTIQDCHEYVPYPVMSACGHPGQIICHKASLNLDPMSDELLRYCKHPCNQILPCKDVCKGTCGDCMQGRIHQVCLEECSNILICGHKCTVPCREDCPPCMKTCEHRCVHSECARKCGAPCQPCMERCEWTCEHKKCTKRCGDLCDREPCFEACKILLECGHPCVGFCGEPCPDLCRICDKERLTEVFFGTEDEEDARFVKLLDCNHILESSGLEEWFNKKPEDGKDKEIGILRCPKCNSPVVKTLRYGNLVKTALKEIIAVKSKIFGCGKDINKILYDLKHNNFPKVTELIKNSPAWVDRIRDLHRIKDLIEPCGVKYLSGGDYTRISKRISFKQINLINFLCICLEEVLTAIRNMSSVSSSHCRTTITAEYEVKLRTRVVLLFHHLSQRAIKISRLEMLQFDREIKRFKRMVEFYELLNKMSVTSLESSSVAVEIDKISSKLFSIKEFDDGDFSEALTNFSNSTKVFYQPVSQEEMSMVQRAMLKDFTSNMKQGHWFQCQNGHIYVITECGGAMERGVCPECNEVIGGENHSLVSTSRLASQVDGATHAAWSETANMANYNF